MRTAPSAIALLLLAAALAGCSAGTTTPDATTRLEVHFAGQATDIAADVRSDLDSRPTADRYRADNIPHPAGYTAHDQLEDWTRQGGAGYTAQSFNSSFGAGYFLTALAGVAADGMSAYWSLSLNGVPAEVGMSEVVLDDGDVVAWTYTPVAAGGSSSNVTDLLSVQPAQPTKGEAVTLMGEVARDATVSVRNGPSLEAKKGPWTLDVPLAAFGQTPVTLVADDGSATQAVELVLVRLASATVETKYTASPTHPDGSHLVWYDPSVHASLAMYDGKGAPRADQYTVHDLLADWTLQTGLPVEYGYSEAFGFSVSKVDGVGQPVDAALPPYWCYQVNGETADFGISLQTVAAGDVVTWEYGACA